MRRHEEGDDEDVLLAQADVPDLAQTALPGDSPLQPGTSGSDADVVKGSDALTGEAGQPDTLPTQSLEDLFKTTGDPRVAGPDMPAMQASFENHAAGGSAPQAAAPATDWRSSLLWASAGVLAGAIALAREGNGGSGTASPAPPPAPSHATMTLSVHAIAGPVLAGHSLQASLYAQDGSLLGGPVALDSQGHADFQLTDYTGFVLVRVLDTNDATADYLDEATLTAADLNEDLRAVAYVAAGAHDAQVTVSPLSEIAVRQLLGDAGSRSGASGVSIDHAALSASAIEASLQDTAARFGLDGDQMMGTAAAPILTTIDANGAAQNPNAAGLVLASLSGLDLQQGMGYTLALLQQGIQSTPSNLPLTDPTSPVIALLAAGAAMAGPAISQALAGALPIAPAVMRPATDPVLVDDAGAITGTLAPSAPSDDTTLLLQGSYAGVLAMNSVIAVYLSSGSALTRLGDAAVVPAVGSAGGTWSFAVPAASMDGPYTYLAQAEAAGIAIGALGSADAVLDTTGPSTPVLALGAGVSNGASLAEATQPGGVVEVSGEAGAGIVVTFTGAGSVIKTLTGTGLTQPVVLTSADLLTLGDGAISVDAVATDAAGNDSPAGTISFVLDTQAPTVPVLALGSGVVGGATASEAVQSAGVVTVIDVNLSRTSSDAAIAVALAPSATVVEANSISEVQLAIANLANGSDEKLLAGGQVFDADGSSLAPGTLVVAGGIPWAVNYAAGTWTFSPLAGMNASSTDAATLINSFSYRNAASALSDGIRTFTITAVDDSGNASAAAAHAQVLINTSPPAAASLSPVVTFDGDGNGVKGDIFEINFSEAVRSDLITAGNIVLSGSATLGTGATITPIGLLTLAGQTYASTYRITGGSGSTYTTGTTLTIASANVIDTAGAAAAANVVFTMPDIVAPGVATPPSSISGDNYVNASEAAAATSIAFSHATANAANGQTLKIYLNGAFVKDVAMTGTSTTFQLSGSDWGADGITTLTTRVQDAAGNLSPFSAPKTLTLDTALQPGFTSMIAITDGGTPGAADQGDVVRVVFHELVALSDSGLPSSVFGTGATATGVGLVSGKSTTWNITLGASPTLSGATGGISFTGVSDTAGNTGAITATVPADIFNAPGVPSIANVTDDNVIDASERAAAQSITVNLSNAKIGDVVKLYVDSVQVGGNVTVTSNGQATAAFSIAANGWGGDGIRSLTATIERGSSDPIRSADRNVQISAEQTHWSRLYGAIWFDPDAIVGGIGDRVSAWTDSSGRGIVAVQADPTHQPTIGVTDFGVRTISTIGGGKFLSFDNSATPGNANGLIPQGSSPITLISAWNLITRYALWNFAWSITDNNSKGIQVGVSVTANALDVAPNSPDVGDNKVSNSNSLSTWQTFTGEYGQFSGQYQTHVYTDGRLLKTVTSTALSPSNRLAIIGSNSVLYFDQSWNGLLGDQFLTGVTLSNSQRLEIETYFAQKYQQGTLVVPNTSDTYDLSTSFVNSALIDERLILQSRATADLITTAGSDYVSAGAGSDTVVVKDLDFRYIDAGTDSDTLRLHSAYSGPSTFVLADFTSNARGDSGNSVDDARVNAAGYHKLLGVETIDLSTSNLGQTIVVSASDVDQLSETNVLHIQLGSNDTLLAQGWSPVVYGYYLNTADNLVYDRKWSATVGGENVELYARGGDLPAATHEATYSGSIVTLQFDEPLAGSAAAADFLFGPGATSPASTATLGGTLVTVDAGSMLSGVVSLNYSGSQLADSSGEAPRHVDWRIGGNSGDTIDESMSTTAVSLHGNDGADIIKGGLQSDLISGGRGDDMLSGGAGADLFAWTANESGTDTVTDFDKASGDKLDLRGLLNGVGFTMPSLVDYVQLSNSGADAVLRIDTSGSAGFSTPTQTINLTNAYTAGNLNDTLTHLISQNVIIVA